MTASITLFAAVTQATGQQLDDDLLLISNQAPIPCTAAGSNTITLTQKSNVYTVTAYGNNMQFSAVATGINTTAATAQLGSLGALPIYKDTLDGPVALSGFEIQTGNAFTLMYDAALNSGGGGFHLFTGTDQTSAPIAPSAIRLGASGASMTRYVSRTASVSFSVINPNSAVESPFSLSGIMLNDAVILGPPSLTANNPVSFLGYVAASNSVVLRAVNAATTTVTVTPGIWRVSGIGGP